MAETENPFFCEDCDEELTHDDVETVAPVPRMDPETHELHEGMAEVYTCGGCGVVVGFDTVDREG
jgi:hypothetical protein